jgi:hypothetical protein
MADTLGMTIQLALDWLYKETQDLTTPTDEGFLKFDKHFADGTGAGQLTKIWRDQRTLASGADEDLDLTALTSSWFTGTVNANFTTIKFIAIVNLSTTSGEDLQIDATVSNAFVKPWNTSTKIEIPADGLFLIADHAGPGWTVTNGSEDILNIDRKSGSASLNYRIVIAGLGT